MSDYDLVYYRKSDGVLFKVKRACPLTYILFNPETNERYEVTRYRLNKDFRCDRKVSRNKSKGSKKVNLNKRAA